MRALPISAALLVAACSSTRSEWHPRDVEALDVREHFVSAGALEPGQVAPGWIASFGDARLTELVGEALERNADLAIAAANVEFARARARLAGSFLVPQVDAFANATRSDLLIGGSPSTRIELGLSASWEADLWGRLSDLERAAAFDADAAQADFVSARHALAAQTARAWFLVLAARARLEIEQRSLSERDRVERITRAHYEAGEAPQGDVDVALGQTAIARQLVEQSRGALRNAQQSLETLLGRYPAGELEASSELPEVPPPPPVGVPSELLERRPDVAAVAHAVRAAFAREDSAEAARLPRITLTGEAGYANDELKGLLDPGNAIWSLGAGLLAPLFDGGRLKSELEAARAQRRAALANYLAVARNAFFEVEFALVAEQTLRAREADLETAVASLSSARGRAEERYVLGESTLLELDQVHIEQYQSERELLQVRLELELQRVDLHLALGGDFETSP